MVSEQKETIRYYYITIISHINQKNIYIPQTNTQKIDKQALLLKKKFSRF